VVHMKCPKCAYLGFDQVDRCRNCGYEFSLSTPSAQPTPDLSLRADSPSLDPLGDLSLVDAAMAGAPGDRIFDGSVDLDRLIGAPTPPAAPRSLAPPRDELPLFGLPITDDEPLITKASPPRQPLAVRRATPEPPKARVEPPAVRGRLARRMRRTNPRLSRRPAPAFWPGSSPSSSTS
jgi:hypothetical protein